MNLLEKFNQNQITNLSKDKEIPDFKAGDTLKVNVKVTEGSNERTQLFEGICIARRNAGVHSSFTVRKISFNEGVERVFKLFSPKISLEVVRRGAVRRAKLYYLRDLRGKSARIPEKRNFSKITKTKSPVIEKNTVVESSENLN